MKESHIIRFTGMLGLIGSLFALIVIPLWLIPTKPPLLSDAEAYATYLANARIVVLTRLLMETFVFMCLMIFFSGFRHMIRNEGKQYEWLASLNYGASIVLWAVLLVAGGLEGSAALNTVGGNSDPTIIRALVEGTLLMYKGPIFFGTWALIMASSGYVILASKTLPSWLGWYSWFCFVLCLVFMPAMFVEVMDNTVFYNAMGWGPGYAAAFPSMMWFVFTGIAMIWKSF